MAQRSGIKSADVPQFNHTSPSQLFWIHYKQIKESSQILQSLKHLPNMTKAFGVILGVVFLIAAASAGRNHDCLALTISTSNLYFRNPFPYMLIIT
jgi:hypothetical protein